MVYIGNLNYPRRIKENLQILGNMTQKMFSTFSTNSNSRGKDKKKSIQRDHSVRGSKKNKKTRRIRKSRDTVHVHVYVHTFTVHMYSTLHSEGSYTMSNKRLSSE